MKEPSDHEILVRLQTDMAEVKQKLKDCHLLAASADKDVADIGIDVRSQVNLMNSLRVTQQEHGEMLRVQGMALGELTVITTDQTRLLHSLRSEMTEGFADVRSEMTEGFADVRSEMTEGFADVRSEMDCRFAKVDGQFTELRSEMTEGIASVRSEMREGFAAVAAAIADLRERPQAS
ncbi:hypothetical protein D5S17_10720 [Pseudonocardiaceae bacterium YIM PH 21723]|nr:hypothetical protein D5S17_10720 [Pseudonocardiaceae bacterium YIM PH 21723]